MSHALDTTYRPPTEVDLSKPGKPISVLELLKRNGWGWTPISELPDDWRMRRNPDADGKGRT